MSTQDQSVPSHLQFTFSIIFHPMRAASPPQYATTPPTSERNAIYTLPHAHFVTTETQSGLFIHNQRTIVKWRRVKNPYLFLSFFFTRKLSKMLFFFIAPSRKLGSVPPILHCSMHNHKKHTFEYIGTRTVQVAYSRYTSIVLAVCTRYMFYVCNRFSQHPYAKPSYYVFT